MPFLILFVLDKQVHLCYLLKHEMKEKRSNQSKVPSINKQALFSFPSLSFFATSCIYSGAFFRSQSKRALGARSLLPDVLVTHIMVVVALFGWLVIGDPPPKK